MTTDLDRLNKAWLDFKRENRLPDDLGVKFGFAFGLYDFETGTFRKPGTGAFVPAPTGSGNTLFGVLTEAATLDPDVPGYVADMTGGAFTATLPADAPIGTKWEIVNRVDTPWSPTDKLTLTPADVEDEVNGAFSGFEADAGPAVLHVVKVAANKWSIQ